MIINHLWTIICPFRKFCFQRPQDRTQEGECWFFGTGIVVFELYCSHPSETFYLSCTRRIPIIQNSTIHITEDCLRCLRRSSLDDCLCPCLFLEILSSETGNLFPVTLFTGLLSFWKTVISGMNSVCDTLFILVWWGWSVNVQWSLLN